MTKSKMTMLAALILFLLSDGLSSTFAADWIESNPPSQVGKSGQQVLPVFKGSADVVDGRTLLFPQSGIKVQLADIDVCELPQWAINPKWNDRQNTKAPQPVPCGSLSKAWLKRVISGSPISCTVSSYAINGAPIGRCNVAGRDLAVEMLKVGWARVTSPDTNPAYLREERNAIAARYGMWATFVLDMEEWRNRANDKTLQRRPIADYNLLLTRRSEISPPFDDLRRKPKRTDR